MSCSMSRNPSKPSRNALLSRDPVTKLSTPMTWWPSVRNRSARWDPRKPAAPVMRTRIYEPVAEAAASAPPRAPPPELAAGTARRPMETYSNPWAAMSTGS